MLYCTAESLSWLSVFDVITAQVIDRHQVLKNTWRIYVTKKNFFPHYFECVYNVLWKVIQPYATLWGEKMTEQQGFGDKQQLAMHT